MLAALNIKTMIQGAYFIILLSAISYGYINYRDNQYLSSELLQVQDDLKSASAKYDKLFQSTKIKSDIDSLDGYGINDGLRDYYRD